ncbi:transposase [Candidatus Desulfarcum epimagneticum]|uniref:Transposase n=1 Tax=uncultured Desulfobacteraceae bacterium TaxID=218296 RepID=A0A484HIY8_9BACT|nr:transposase [uncultured Desulfobacteraceae bacterium]
MIPLSSIISEFKDRFYAKYKSIIMPGHKKALQAMEQCRKEHGPHILARCADHNCGCQTYIPHSCGHRNCPHCQNHESHQWIDNQLGKLLPAQYYLITFTLPSQLRDLARKNQKKIYSLMFSCVRDVLKTFTQNDKKLQGSAGFTAMLHTHSRRLDYHPHMHVVMPGASINAKTRLWRVKSSDYLFSHKALAKVFRAKFLEAIVAEKLRAPKNCPKQWVVDCKNVGKGDKALIYLGKYLYRGVIQEKDILKCENGMVTFRYLHSKKKRRQIKTVTGEYFLFLLMLHVLPKGFRRVRSYGFLHPCSKKLISILRLILRVNPFMILKQTKERPSIACPVCGAKMKIILTMISKPPRRQKACT